MKRLYTTLLFAALLTALLVAACGDGNNENTATTNNTETNNTEPNNTETNNTANNVNNTDPNNRRDEPFITQFRSYEERDSALGSNTVGFTISVSGGTISNEDGNSKPLVEADLLAFEEAHLGADTITAMRNGWNCPEPMDDTNADVGADAGADAGTGTGSGTPSTFWFEARIQEDGNDREIQEITGCVETDDPATGAIIDAINALGEQYL